MKKTKNEIKFKLLSEIKYVYLNGNINNPVIAIPLKYTKRTALKLAKRFYLKYQKENKREYLYRIPSHNKIIKNFVTTLELFYSSKKYSFYKCWIINLTDDSRRFMHEKNRSEKATYKIQLKRYKAMNKLIDRYLEAK